MKCDFCEQESEDVIYCEDPYVSELYPEENIEWNYYCSNCLEARHDDI